MAIERVSLNNSGIQGNDDSESLSISGDGRFVAFYSSATNLVPGDTNGEDDIFVYDRESDEIERVSVDNSGIQGNNSSFRPSISSDGRFVAFDSEATNLVPGDTNGVSDIFVYDRESDEIERVSVDNSGIQGNNPSFRPSISSDGRFVAFDSGATNLVPGDTNGRFDIFVYDRASNVIERVSLDNSGIQGNNFSTNPSISSDGRFVAFQAGATNFVPGDTNGNRDIFAYDREINTIERISVDSSGLQSNGDSSISSNSLISSDGRFVAFQSNATNLVSGDTNGNQDIFVYDRGSGTIERVSIDNSGIQGNGDSFNLTMSGNGQLVTFGSNATNLVPGDTNAVGDGFVYDRESDEIERVSVDNSGIQGNSDSFNLAISSNGQFVAFNSDATNLVPGDTNGFRDVFVVSRLLTENAPVIRLIQLGGTTRSFENYATDTYQIVLTEIPLDDVTISLTADSDLTVDPASLTFTPDNFNLAQIVTVSGRADGTIADRTLTIDHTVNSRDTNYEILPIDPVNVRLIDIDDIGNIQAQTRFFPRAFGDQSDQITASDEGSLLLGRDGNDVLLGANGPDQLYGNDGDDLLTGERNSDALFGGGGDDILIGGSEVDVLYGGESDDILYGDDGNDFLFGGRGNDELFGGSGNDALQGGFDSDVFVIGLNRGLDTFLDFQARLDRINLIDGLTFADLTIEQEATTNDSQIIETATGNILAILKTTPFNTIAASDFF